MILWISFNTVVITFNFYSCCSVAKLCLTLCNPLDYSTPGCPFLHYLPEFTQIHIHWVNDAIQWCYASQYHPFSSSCPQSFPASGSFPMKQLFCIRLPKSWSFSFSITPSSEYSRLISLRIGWFDLLAVQGNLKSLLQHHNSKASILQLWAFFMSISVREVN